jgi:hypothetical protein
MLPGVVVDAVSDKVEPVHIGLLLPATGVAGGLGSDRTCGPTLLDGQPASVVTLIFVYVPAGRLSIVNIPLALEVIVVVTGLPFFI